ncbi:hypothetical protein SASPL_117072 [Salvia splendens]|uniref:Disease resistance protein RPM1 n=1 Tax=Salvia splendens TaxID=180675 RepID=A0A8X8XU64_SALSN|nr:hypothetical protein SASPL_117072 [Salvia splendens]
MAAYSAVVSLEKHLKQLLESDQSPLHDQKPHLQSFYNTISTLRKSVETIFPAPKQHRQTAAALATLIRDAIYHAQDALDSFLSAKSPTFSFPPITQTIHPIANQAQSLADSIRKQKPLLGAATEADIPPPPRSYLVTRTFRIVGQERDKQLLIEELVSDVHQLQIVPISGMAGIGKTTLARSLYDDRHIMNSFHFRAWVTVSQDYHVGDILARLLNSMDKKGQKAVERVYEGSDDLMLRGRLEKVAEDYLVDLTQRNLITVRKISSSGRIKTCGLHDSLRDLAVKESGTEKFFHSVRRYANAQILEEVAKSQRRVSVHKNILICLKDVYHSAKLISDARTLIYAGSHHHHPMPLFLSYDLLRVLDAYTVYFIRFPRELAHLIHLRYLSLTYNGKLASTLSNLQNLQVLIVRRQPRIIYVGKSFLPDEFWGMQQLRHLVMTETDLPKIPETPPLFENLQSLTNIHAASCTRGVLKMMPNLKKLSMWVEKAGVVSLYPDELKQLEVFKFTVFNPRPSKKMEFESEFYLPPKLRKLSLSGCGLPWEAMGVVAKLEHLEVLKLRELAFNGDEWCLLDSHVFERLKYMMIEYLNFKTWEANNVHFPALEQLHLRHCYDLEEIPLDIGFIGPLRLIELVDCGRAAVGSAATLKEQHEGVYDKDFQVRILFSSEALVIEPQP